MEPKALARGVTRLPRATLVVRPQLCVVQLSLSVEVDLSAALPSLRRAAERLEALLPSTGATLHLDDVGFTQGVSSKSYVAEGATRLEGTLTLPLADGEGFWERAHRVAQLDDLLRALVAEGRKQKPALEVRRALPTFAVLDAEAHRPQLLEAALARARALGEAVQLQQLKWAEPVAQRSLGLEQVELTLALEGCAQVNLEPAPAPAAP